MGKGIFITGTDTGVGKTRVTVVLMEELKRLGYQVAGMKPVASGATVKNGILRNEDAELILQSCSRPTDYELINPYVFEPAVSPHFAARQAGQIIDLDKVECFYQQLLSENDIVVIEGVGGWSVPLSEDITMVDLVRKLGLPVILVVGLRLGCLNHASLSAKAINTDGFSLVGWVSNQLDESYLLPNETIETLKSSLNSPYLANLSFSMDSDSCDEFDCLNMSLISSSL